MPLQLHDWKEFYGLEGAASATLMGLLFVAVALNADLILAGGRTQTKIRAEQAFQNYIAVLVIAQMLLIPHIPMRVLSVSLQTQASIMILFSASRLIKVTKINDPNFEKSHGWRRLLPSLVAYGLIIYGSWRILHLSDDDPFYFIGSGSIILLITATISSWDLLIKVAEIRHNMSK